MITCPLRCQRSILAYYSVLVLVLVHCTNSHCHIDIMKRTERILLYSTRTVKTVQLRAINSLSSNECTNLPHIKYQTSLPFFPPRGRYSKGHMTALSPYVDPPYRAYLPTYLRVSYEDVEERRNEPVAVAVIPIPVENTALYYKYIQTVRMGGIYKRVLHDQ